MQPYFMPVQGPNGVFYQQVMPQYQPMNFVQGQPLPVGQVYNPPQFVQMPQAEPEIQVPQGPSLIEMVRNATPEHFYRSLLRIFACVTGLCLAFLLFGAFTRFTDDHHAPGNNHGGEGRGGHGGHGRGGHFVGMMILNLALNMFGLINGLKAMKIKSVKRFRRFLKIMGAIFAISAYKLVTAVLFGMGGKLIAVVFVIQSGYLLCRGRKYLKAYFKSEWRESREEPIAENHDEERINAGPQVVEMQQQTIWLKNSA
jgi:hypothetical protein